MTLTDERLVVAQRAPRRDHELLAGPRDSGGAAVDADERDRVAREVEVEARERLRRAREHRDRAADRLLRALVG